MATTTWQQRSVIVGDGGKIEIVLPELQAGETVEVSVHRRVVLPLPAERPMGFLKGKISMADDFDAPLDEFDPYTK